MSDYKSLIKKYEKEFKKRTPLVCLCEKGRLEDVKKFINAATAAKKNVTKMLNEVGKDSIGRSRTPLMIAAKYEHFQVVDYLIEECKANPAITDTYGWNALHYAASNSKQNTKTVDYLLKNMHPKDINKETKFYSIMNEKNTYENTYKHTPLDLCYENINSPIKQLLIELFHEKGGIRNLVGKYKKEFPEGTPLVCACEKGRLEDVKELIRAAGLDVKEMVDKLGKDSEYNSRTPLMIAAENEHFQIVYYLIKECKANPAIINNCGRNALHYAAGNNKKNTETVDYLLKNMKTEDIKHKDNDGDTPLILCYRDNSSKIQQDLIDLIRKKVVEVDLEEIYKKAFPKGDRLVVACEKGHMDDVKTFIDDGMQVNEKGYDSEAYGNKCTPLMAAAWKEHLQIVKYLIKNGADPNIADSSGKNALHLAAGSNETNTDIVKLLLKNMTPEGINHKVNYTGYTPLDWAYNNKSPIKQKIINLIAKRASELSGSSSGSEYVRYMSVYNNSVIKF